MKVRAQIRGLDGLGRRLTQIAETAVVPAVEAATDALAHELERARENAGLSAPLLRDAAKSTQAAKTKGTPRRRRVGANDPESLGRELGSPVRAPAPWLTPVLPGARSPMRAAARIAVARAISSLRPRRK